MVTVPYSNYTIPGLCHDWDFQPSKVARWEYRRTAELFLRKAHRRPAWHEVKAIDPKPAWIVYFVYTPDGLLGAAQEFTLSRLRDIGLPLLVVCASRNPSLIPVNLAKFCDALFWKDLPGYDFSAYTLALREISKRSPGADVLVMNDSVFGPFEDLKIAFNNSHWDLTGFTASNQLTNHIQSYSFILRNVDRSRMRALSSVFFPFASISDPHAVVYIQESRLARVASRSMKVGAFWFGDKSDVVDPTLVRPLEPIENGFPFLKRSLLTKHNTFIDPERVRACLERFNHPTNLR